MPLLLSVFLIAQTAAPAARSSAPPSTPRPAQAERAQLDAAIDLYLEARFGESAALLDRLQQTDPSPAVAKQTKLYLALNFLALGNPTQARRHLQDLLDLDPEYELPAFVSPSVRSFFLQTKSNYKVVPQILHLPPPPIDGEKGAQLDFSLKRMRPAYKPKFYFRRTTKQGFLALDMTRDTPERYRVMLPPSLLLNDSAYVLEYYATVTDQGGKPLAQLRDAQDPFHVPVSFPTRDKTNVPVYKRWWFWTAIGGVVAAGAVVTVVLVTRAQAPHPTTGGADVSVTF